MAVVIITGCNSGFGLESALAFARQSDRVYATMRNPAKGQALIEAAKEENLDIQIKPLDVTESETFTQFFQEIVEEAGQIDVLVNNAGILRPGALEDLSESTIREVMETNCIGPLLLSRAVLPFMREQSSGYIITISSLSGLAGLPGDVVYTTSKFAVEGAMEALRHEVDRWNIKIALVEPGLYATNILEQSKSTASMKEELTNDSPYKALIQHKLNEVMERLPSAPDPAAIGALLVKISNSDGSQLRWPADETGQKVFKNMFAQDDIARDTFLREISGTDWWSEGKDVP